MAIKSRIIVIGILSIAATTTIADQRTTAKFTRFKCTVIDSALIVNCSCKITPISRNKTVLNMYGHFTRQVDTIILHLQVFQKFNHVYKPFLVDVYENYCHIFSKKTSVPYTKIAYSIIAPYTNLNHSCPYSDYIFFKDIPMDASKLRNMWPFGEYRVDIGVFANGSPNLSVTFQVYAELGEKILWIG